MTSGPEKPKNDSFVVQINGGGNLRERQHKNTHMSLFFWGGGLVTGRTGAEGVSPRTAPGPERKGSVSRMSGAVSLDSLLGGDVSE